MDRPSKIIWTDRGLAQETIKKISEGSIGWQIEFLTDDECDELGFNREQCEIVRDSFSSLENNHKILTKVDADNIRIELANVGFRKEYIDELVGIDGKKVLRARAHWISDNVIELYKQNRYGTMSSPIREFANDYREHGALITPALTTIFNDFADDCSERNNIAYFIFRLDEDLSMDFYAELIDECGEGSRDNVYASLASIALKDYYPIEGLKRNIDVLINDLNKPKGEYDLRYLIQFLEGANEFIVPYFIEALEGNDEEVRKWIVIGLGRMGKVAKDAIPALIKIADNDPDPEIRNDAGRAIVRIYERIW